ncbi:MAG: aminopeptidase P N-terminal domain-containing protein [Hymenobacter sp.]|nr:aminopeptidase P N-terminal domain-containing protein [Hymenobacter sp.]
MLLALLLTGFGSGAYAQRAAGAGRPADFLDPAFHRGRRELLRQALPAGSVAVLFAAPVRNRANDVNYLYHQHPDFYYLTGYEEPDAVLVLFKEPQTMGGQTGITEALFVQPRDPKAETWTGRRLGADGAAQLLKVQYAADNTAFAGAGIRWADFGHIHFLDLPTDVRNDPQDPADLADLVATFRRQAAIPADFSPEQTLLVKVVQRYGYTKSTDVKAQLESLVKANPSLSADASIKAYLQAPTEAEQQRLTTPPISRYASNALNEALDELRAVKTSEELALLRRAIRISTVGQQEVMKALRPDMGEMEVQGLHEYVYKKYGAEFEGYPSIVGAGNNSCILHYETNDKPRLGNDLLLMDCGAEYHGYTADVTRTVPPSGKFSPAQRQIYELVLAAQEAGIRQCRPGNEFQAPGKAAQQVITEGLTRLGIIQQPEEMRRYFPHGTSHYLGLDVHDRGRYGPLKAGNVITVEPGIYIPEGSPCDQKWWNIGVRIEDDILITGTGAENLSEDAPRTAAEVEALMAKPSSLNDFKLPKL